MTTPLAAPVVSRAKYLVMVRNDLQCTLQSLFAQLGVNLLRCKVPNSKLNPIMAMEQEGVE
jgi:hypothetical protein